MKNIIVATLIILTFSLETFYVPNCKAPLTLINVQNQTDIGKINYFVHDQNGSSQFTSPSTLKACHDANYLYLNYSLVDTDIVANLKGCNSALYTEDAVEFFISSNASYPHDYFEFEVSPRGELFFADINNPNLNCSVLNTVYQQCNSVTYGATITSNGWDAWLIVNLQIISRGQSLTKFYGNFFRIDKNAGQTTKYLCWQSTLANPPCFHKPSYFGQINLI